MEASSELNLLNAKISIIEAVLNGDLRTRFRSAEEIERRMAHLRLDYSVYQTMTRAEYENLDRLIALRTKLQEPVADKLKRIQAKIKIISAILNKELKFRGRRIEEVQADLTQLGLDFNIFESLTMVECTQNHLDKLLALSQKLQN